VSEIDTELDLFGLIRVPVNANNSIGLMMVVGEVILVVVTLLFFEDPAEKKEHKTAAAADDTDDAADTDDTDTDTGKCEEKGFWYAIGHFNIFFPVFIGLVIFSIFPLIGIAMSPVAKNVGWNTVRIAEVSSLGSTTMAVGLFMSAVLSMKNVSDLAMIAFGISGFGVSGLLMYFWWEGDEIGYFQLAVPVCLIFFSYPFMGPANRSLFTKAIHDKKECIGCQGVLLGLVNQGFALSGLVAPVFVTTFVLRQQEDIETSTNKHQVTVAAFYVPILCSLVFTGLIYQYFFVELNAAAKNDSNSVSESTTLMSHDDNNNKNLPRASMIEISDTFSRASEVNRRMSVECMGIINPVDTKYEKELNDKLAKDKKEWEEIIKMDAIEK